MSYVISSDSEVEIQLGSFETVPLVCPDGRVVPNIEQGDVLKIRRYDKTVQTINLGMTGFFQNIKRKIVARGSFYEDGKE
jgi:NAD+ kinase